MKAWGLKALMTRQRRMNLETQWHSQQFGRQARRRGLPLIAFLLIPNISHINLPTIPYVLWFSLSPCLCTCMLFLLPWILPASSPFHCSLLFLMNSYTSFRVQLKYQHYYIVLPKPCPNPVPHGHGSWSFPLSPLHVSDDISVILLPSDDNGFPLNYRAGVFYSASSRAVGSQRNHFFNKKT